MSLMQKEKQLLDIIQTNFPISPRPYKELGDSLGIGEEEALKIVKKLKKDKLIRRLGANFQSAKLGFRSSLCAAKVPEEKLNFFIETVNAYPNTTHNYLRKHDFNIWFTLIAPSWERLVEILAEITAKTNVEVLNLPATKLYKIKVNFKVTDEE